MRLVLNFLMYSSKVILEEFVRRSLRASPLMKPLLTPGGWHVENSVYWNVSVGLKCVFTSRTDSVLNLSPLYTLVSKKVVSVSEISAVNLIVGWWLLHYTMNCCKSSLLLSQRQKMSSMKRLKTKGLYVLLLRICVSIFAIKILAKATAILVPMAVPCVWR